VRGRGNGGGYVIHVFGSGKIVSGMVFEGGTDYSQQLTPNLFFFFFFFFFFFLCARPRATLAGSTAVDPLGASIGWVTFSSFISSSSFFFFFVSDSSGVVCSRVLDADCLSIFLIFCSNPGARLCKHS
jgi:hypothetical protein